VAGVAFVVWLLYLGGLDANKTLLIGSIISGTLLFLGARPHRPHAREGQQSRC
jgi:hypothetical protein